MTIVEWSVYSEFEVDKSLSGDASSGVPHAVLREFGSPPELSGRYIFRNSGTEATGK
jgi:hypothetical protein